MGNGIIDEFTEDSITTEASLSTKIRGNERLVQQLEEYYKECLKSTIRHNIYDNTESMHVSLPTLDGNLCLQLTPPDITAFCHLLGNYQKHPHFAGTGNVLTKIITEMHANGHNNFLLDLSCVTDGVPHPDNNYDRGSLFFHLNSLRYDSPLEITLQSMPSSKLDGNSVIYKIHDSDVNPQRNIGNTFIVDGMTLPKQSSLPSGNVFVFRGTPQFGEYKNHVTFTSSVVAVQSAPVGFGQYSENTHFYATNQNVLEGIKLTTREGCTFTLLSRSHTHSAYGIPDLYQCLMGGKQ